MGTTMELVRVRFVESVCGPFAAFQPRQEAELPAKQAAKYVAAGQAIYLGREVETAMESIGNEPRRRGRPRKVETR